MNAENTDLGKHKESNWTQMNTDKQIFWANEIKENDLMGRG
jgi:hypothetical protein